jgi:hypothetical protein
MPSCQHPKHLKVKFIDPPRPIFSVAVSTSFPLQKNSLYIYIHTGITAQIVDINYDKLKVNIFLLDAS